MVATVPLNRIFREAPTAAKPQLPECEFERGKLWSDSVLDAVLALRNQLSSKNEAIVAAAANSILELERTRMRHDKCVSGTRNRPGTIDDEQPVLVANITEPAPAEVSEANVQRIADHADEIREHMDKSLGRPMTESEATAYVVEKLGRWQVRPSVIHRGEFLKMLGLINELPGAVADPNVC